MEEISIEEATELSNHIRGIAKLFKVKEAAVFNALVDEFENTSDSADQLLDVAHVIIFQ